jgi:hypothetical protein
MTTRFAPISMASGHSPAAWLRETARKVVAYIVMLSETFAEAKALAHAAQKRGVFIED